MLVGAQAVYLHTGAADLAVAEHTTDGDLALDPALLGESPPLQEALEQAGFIHSSREVGIWKTHRPVLGRDVEVQVDLLVPRALSPGRGRRAARLPGHEATVARMVDGLEGALVDREERVVCSLVPEVDSRRAGVMVAGPAALVVAKVHKISERTGTPRSNDKDALDILRILQAIPTAELTRRWRLLIADARSAVVARRGLELLEQLFGTRGSEGAAMAARATRPLMDGDQVRLMCEVLCQTVLRDLGQPEAP